MNSWLAVLALLGGVAVGVVIGWYLRPAASWCPHCGDGLACQACGHRLGWRSRLPQRQNAS
jgi:hypothetical protein